MTMLVALCTYNGAAYPQEPLRNILNQTRRPSEIVVSDDGSTDSMPSLVEGVFAERQDNHDGDHGDKQARRVARISRTSRSDRASRSAYLVGSVQCRPSGGPGNTTISDSQDVARDLLQPA